MCSACSADTSYILPLLQRETVVDGIGVYKTEVQEQQLQGLPIELKQALTFLPLF